MQIFVRLFLGLKMTPNAVFWCRTADVVASASSSSFFFGVVQKLRWPNFAHFWPPTHPWVTFLKEFLYYYFKEKSAYLWHFQYHLSTSSCQHNLWTTPSYIPQAMFNSIKDSCLKYFFQLKISIFSIFKKVWNLILEPITNRIHTLSENASYIRTKKTATFHQIV